MPTLVSVQRGRAETYADPAQQPLKPWTSAIFKTPVEGPVAVQPLGLEGDEQADRRFHGGIDKAVLAYSADHYPEWRDLLGRPEMSGGGFGENLTFSGITEETVCVGDLWSVGTVLLQVSQPRQPCWKLSRKWDRIDLPKLVAGNGRTGWYLRVLQPGELEAGMSCQLVQRLHPDWTIARANRALFDRDFPNNEAWDLADLPELADAWRQDLTKRLEPRGSQRLFE
ncbi:MOSC domain-containing protein [Planctomicrobium sp. SH664]|uniref:MOSC domain-containing protein n=1 Tax=Planctomicrobium sp. SH664 TaxID=3448125 RepID=UPI003F5B412B